MGPWVVAIMFALLGLAPAADDGAGLAAEKGGETSFTIHPIGYVRKVDGKTILEIDGKYEEGLLGLDKWTHVQVFWWFHKNDTPQRRRILRVHPRGDRDNPLTGVFACRAPVRPNLVALTACKILSVEGRRVHIEKIDAFDGTPVIDLKPYAPGIDRISDAKAPDWARRKRPAPPVETP